MANEIKQLTATLKSTLNTLIKKRGLHSRGKVFLKLRKSNAHSFLSRTETALCFSKAFDLELELLKVKETHTGKTHETTAEMKAEKLGENPTQAGSEADMSRIETILYLLDTFCFSD